MSDMGKSSCGCGANKAKDLDNSADAQKKQIPVATGAEADIVAAQCVCDMEWRAIKPEDDSDDCRCLS